jgi:Tol biopolymer transport system component
VRHATFRIALPLAVVVLVLVAFLARDTGDGSTGTASGTGAEPAELTAHAGEPAPDVGPTSTVFSTTLAPLLAVPAAPVTSTTTTSVAAARTAGAQVAATAASLRGKVVFLRQRAGEVRIFWMNPDGTGQTFLADAPGAQNLRWSPDGTRLAYDDGRNVHIFNVDGSGTTRIPIEATQPSWSPDGTQLAVVRIEPYANIYVINLDGTNLRLVVKDGSGPAWSPDGRRIAFSRYDPQGNSIYTVTPDGNNLTRVSSLEGHADSPAWSIDGSALAFRHNTDLSVIGADGNGGRPIVFPPGSPEGPSWFPDGSGVAFTLYRGDDDCSIMAVNRDGSGYRQLTSSPTCDRDPAVNQKR